MVRLLLAHGARPTVMDDAGDTPIHTAARIGHLQLVTMLVRHGADLYCPDRDGAPAIHLAARHGHDTVVGVLVMTFEVGLFVLEDSKRRVTVHTCCPHVQ